MKSPSHTFATTKKVNYNIIKGLRNSYSAIRECLKAVEGNANSVRFFLTKFNRIYQNSQQSNVLCSKEEFDSIISEKNKDYSESLIKSELNNKHNFTISVFKSLINQKNEEVLREILKDDYLRSSVRLSLISTAN